MQDLPEAPSPQLWRALTPTALVSLAMLGSVGMCVGYPCVPTGIRYGMWLDQCPATDLRLSAQVAAGGLVRGKEAGTVSVLPTANWLDGDRPWSSLQQGAMRRGVTVTWSLRRDDEDVEGLVLDGPWIDGPRWRYTPTLPDVPDGDYVLRAHLDAGFESVDVDSPLALYTPAVVHVASDRPLYKPGQTVELRSVVLARTDLTPLDDRPGRWVIRAPDGTEMHTERSDGGPWGISATSFPLSGDAEHGTWVAAYQTGAERIEHRFDVEPFQLPRLSVEAKGSAPWFRIGETARIEGRAVYASGAPVRAAKVTARLRVTEGRWPMPLAWEEPLVATTLPDGTFSIDVGRVPADLMDRAVLSASLQAVDTTGEVVTGSASVVLAVDDVAVDAVTELRDGLVQSANNRVYVRVRTPDGRALADHDVVLSSPFDPDAPTYTATTDVDGVASVQLDPGEPITVVEAAPPARPRPLTPAEPSLANATELVGNRVLDMAERRAFDRAHPAIARCGQYVTGSARVDVAVRAAPSGAITEAVAGPSAVEQCVARAMRSLSLPRNGKGAMYGLSWSVPDPLTPSLRWEKRVARGASSSSLDQALEQAGLEARRCYPIGSGYDGGVVATVRWSLQAGSSRPNLDVTYDGAGLPASARACLTGQVGGIVLDAPHKGDAAAGVSVARLSVPKPPGFRAPQPIARAGFELAVAVSKGKTDAGTTRLQLGVGAIPPLRMRAEPPVAAPGDTVTVKLLRGPSWSGQLPKELWLRQGYDEVLKAQKDEGNAFAFAIPADASGFYDVEFDGARTVVFVAPANPLAVSLSTDQAVYRPGEEATLTVRTTAGEAGQPAAVMLAGVDQTLAQLRPLTPTDDLGSATVRVSSDTKAFDVFDARMLALGQVRGTNAAQAAVLGVGQLPRDHAGDVASSGHGSVAVPAEEALSAAFYDVLEALVPKVRAWEDAAGDGKTMGPVDMARLWKEARAEVAAVDGYGRALGLHVLPDDLLAQVDPRSMVADATRLPEDVEPWIPYVRSEVRR